MKPDPEELDTRIDNLAAAVGQLYPMLKDALRYVTEDPQISLTKSRIVLERVLQSVYPSVTGRNIGRATLGNILNDKEFSAKVCGRVRARMNLIRELANLGPHGGRATEEDSTLVLRVLVDVLDWCAATYPPVERSATNAEFVEILSRLKVKHPSCIRPDITSVRFGQSVERCFLEITIAKSIGDLIDETITRTDLGFIVCGSQESGRVFDTRRPVEQNACQFANEFDAYSIAHCTDLFTAEACTRVCAAYESRGELPDVGDKITIDDGGDA
jgi:hypothetical protein